MQLFIVAFIILILDQATKFAALHTLTDAHSIAVIPNIFYLTFVQNQGIAFGMFQEHSGVLLLLIGACVIVLVGYFAFVPESRHVHKICYGFILGGALGNLIDRFRLGFVVDFLDFKIWPVFNIADSFITIGVALLIFLTFKESRHAS